MFNGIWLVASEPLTLQGREVKTGERFHISRVHSGALLVTGRAQIAHPQPPPKQRAPDPPEPARRTRTRTRKTAEPTIEDTTPPPAIPESVATPEAIEEVVEVQRRSYQRRDLEAEE